MIIESPIPAGRGASRHATPNAPDRELENTVLRLVESHRARESEALAAYELVAADPSAGHAVRYLARLILDDEQIHHRLFEEMANELKSFVWEVDIEPRVPAMPDRTAPATLQQTEALLAVERADAKELRRLRRALRHSPRSSLHPLLVDLMLHDTQKHIAILEYVRDRLRMA